MQTNVTLRDEHELLRPISHDVVVLVEEIATRGYRHVFVRGTRDPTHTRTRKITGAKR